MKLSTKKLFAMLLCLAVLMSSLELGFAAEPDDIAGRIHSARDCMVSFAHKGEVDLLSQQDLLPAGNSLSDWTAISFYLAGIKDDYEGYKEALSGYVKDCYEKYGCIDRVKATEYQRIILAVLAVGGDPQCFSSGTDGEPVDLLADGTYDFAGYSLGRQGLNGLIFALIALDSKGYEVPSGAKYTRESIIEEILSSQEEDGSFGLDRGNPNVDITAMTLQAFSPYYSEREDVRVSADRALDWLSSQLSENCCFADSGSETSESLSQVIIALCSLGIDPETDSRFKKGDKDLLDALEGFSRDGGYAHETGEFSADFMATQQAMLALTALYRLRTGQPRIYDFSGEIRPIALPEKASNEGNNASSGAVYIAVAAAAVLITACAAVVIRRRKKNA